MINLKNKRNRHKTKDLLLIDNAPIKDKSASKMRPPRHNLSLGKSQLHKQRSRPTTQLERTYSSVDLEEDFADDFEVSDH